MGRWDFFLLDGFIQFLPITSRACAHAWVIVLIGTLSSNAGIATCMRNMIGQWRDSKVVEHSSHPSLSSFGLRSTIDKVFQTAKAETFALFNEAAKCNEEAVERNVLFEERLEDLEQHNSFLSANVETLHLS